MKWEIEAVNQQHTGPDPSIDNSISDSNVHCVNRLLLRYGDKVAGKLWEVGKSIGVTFDGDDHEMIRKIGELEARDRLGSDGLNQREQEGRCRCSKEQAMWRCWALGIKGMFRLLDLACEEQGLSEDQIQSRKRLLAEKWKMANLKENFSLSDGFCSEDQIIPDWFENSLWIDLGRGDKGRFWLDRWVGENPLKILFPRLFSVAQDKTALVKDCGLWVDGNWNWAVGWRRPLFAWEEEEESRLLAFIQREVCSRDSDDSWKWGFSAKGSYEVKEAYKDQIFGHQDQDDAARVGPYTGDGLDSNSDLEMIDTYEKELGEMKHMTKRDFVLTLRRKSNGFS
ncbi:hypothetical protein RIF29_30076 [Crotalaria pallida]|uniref:Uncharacterized protein n=1 Tax=Crotalaria pallida TaxID=3830 RepID=A0AAN9EFP0_CROPI